MLSKLLSISAFFVVACLLFLGITASRTSAAPAPMFQLCHCVPSAPTISNTSGCPETMSNAVLVPGPCTDSCHDDMGMCKVTVIANLGFPCDIVGLRVAGSVGCDASGSGSKAAGPGKYGFTFTCSPCQ